MSSATQSWRQHAAPKLSKPTTPDFKYISLGNQVGYIHSISHQATGVTSQECSRLSTPTHCPAALNRSKPVDSPKKAAVYHISYMSYWQVSRGREVGTNVDFHLSNFTLSVTRKRRADYQYCGVLHSVTAEFSSLALLGRSKPTSPGSNSTPLPPPFSPLFMRLNHHLTPLERDATKILVGHDDRPLQVVEKVWFDVLALRGIQSYFSSILVLSSRY
jgi:hypothetical protein